MENNKSIYLDYSATTPVADEVIDSMLPFWKDGWGNPSSSHHFGQKAKLGLETARRKVADLINAKPSEIVFTGSGSEADNLALRGAMRKALEDGRGNHLIVSSIEHEAVLLTAEQLALQPEFEVTFLPVNGYGQVEITTLEEAIRSETVLVSIMAANNEIGSLQPIEEISKICQEHNILFHTDAIQAAQFIQWDMAANTIDMLAMAPHKFYGPKGVGIMYIREGTPIISTMTGGGQENGHRAGTVNVPFAVGAAKALEIAYNNRNDYVEHTQNLRDILIKGVMKQFSADEVQLTGHPTERLPHHASFAFRDLPGGDLVMHLDLLGIAASSGSACSSGNPIPSAVLQSIGLDRHWNAGGLRLTVGKHTSENDIYLVLKQLPQAVESLKKFAAVLFG
ncbi:MAG: cysteine desulfurase family protein [Chloroflexota bacterium]